MARRNPKTRRQPRSIGRVWASAGYDPQLDAAIEKDRDRFTTEDGRPSRSLVLVNLARFHYFGSGEIAERIKHAPRRNPLRLVARR